MTLSDHQEQILPSEPLELDLRSGELRKAGVRIRLQHQPLKVLSLLALRSGQVVTRQDLQQQIWGSETFVDFEHGVNFCIRQIRRALCDDANRPRYIETLPRYGYRFIAKVVSSSASVIEFTSGSLLQKENPSSRSPAHGAYLKGRFFWNKRTAAGLNRALQYFTQAIQSEPSWAPGYSGLADSYILLGVYVGPPRTNYLKAKSAALKALAIDATLPEARTSLALLKFLYDWDWLAAEQEFKRAIELDQDHANAHHWYAIYLAARGRLNDAIAEINRAHELEPLSLIIDETVGWILSFAGQFDEAIEQYRGTLEMDPYFAPARGALGLAYEQKSMFNEAISEFRKAAALTGGSTEMLAAVGHCHAVSGERSKAEEIIGELRTLSTRRYVSPYDMALIFVGLGQYDRAFRLLRKASQERCTRVVWSKVEPRLESVRCNPSFQKLLIGLKNEGSTLAASLR